MPCHSRVNIVGNGWLPVKKGKMDRFSFKWTGIVIHFVITSFFFIHISGSTFIFSISKCKLPFSDPRKPLRQPPPRVNESLSSGRSTIRSHRAGVGFRYKTLSQTLHLTLAFPARFHANMARHFIFPHVDG